MRLLPAEPLPASLEHAIEAVARDFGLDPNWMNTEVGAQWEQGLPPWIEDDLRWESFGDGLDVGLAGRRTLIAMKLYAAADQDLQSVHFQDLVLLEPSDAELEETRQWVLTQDEFPRWPDIVDEVIDHAKRRR